ncbi:hypothetical protein GGE65_004693 [Skermanella aerolata]|uniref:hypothetical protein n=1 Tax=Skermanella aerolata TaxID=393310 RepID=UPI003D192F84
MKILEAKFSLQDAAALAGLSTTALYKLIARGSLTIARKNGGMFQFTFNDVVAVAAFADLMRSGIPASAADKAACLISDGELPNHLQVRKRVEIWICITRTAERDEVATAWGADKLRDVLTAAGGNVTTLVRLHSLTAEIADAMRAEGAR